MAMDAVSKGWTTLLVALLVSACSSSESESNLPDNPLFLENDPDTVEGNSGTTDMLMELTSTVAQTVSFRTFNISAAAISDYQPTSGTLTFAANETLSLTIPILGDSRVEATESIGIELTYANGARSQLQGAIVNDDFPGLSLGSETRLEVDQGSTPLEFTVSLEEPTLDPFPLRIRTVTTAPGIGIALAGVDYVAIDQTSVIPAGASGISLNVDILGDTLVEPDETFTLEVLDETGQSLASAQGTIQDNDNPNFKPQLQVTLAASNEPEGAAGDVTDMRFMASLPSPPGFSYAMDYEVLLLADDTATAGEDLTLQTGTLVFAPDENQQEIVIQVTGDDALELDETFTLRLFSTAGFEFDRAKGTIVNDDVPTVLVSSPTQLEGSSGATSPINFTIELAQAPPGPFTFFYRTRAGTAIADDYTATGTQEFTLTPENYQLVVTVAVAGDTDFEPDETFDLVVSSSRSGGIDDELARGTATIENDDLPTALLFIEGGQQPLEGSTSSSPNTVSVKVSLSSPALSLLTYNYRTFSGTGGNAAFSDLDVGSDVADFVNTTGQVQINRDEQTSTNSIEIELYADHRIEGEETFLVRLYENEESANSDVNEKAELEITIRNDDELTLSMVPATLTVPEGNPDPGDNQTLNDLTTLVTEADRPRILVEGAEIEEGFTVFVDIEDSMDTDSGDLELASSTLTVDVPADDYTGGGTFDITGILVGADNVLENDETVRLRIHPDTFDQVAVTEDSLIPGSNTTLTLTLANDDTLQVGFNTTDSATDSEADPQQTPQLEVQSAMAANYSSTGPGGEALDVQVSLGATSTANEDDFNSLSTPTDLAVLANGNGLAIGDLFEVLTVNDDDLIEPDETALLRLTSLSTLVEISVDDDESTYTLSSDDQLTVTFAQADYTYTEGNIPSLESDRIGFIITGGILGDSPELSFDLAASAGSATAGDYEVASPFTVTIPPGTYQDADNAVLYLSAGQFNAEADSRVEATETLTLSLAAITAGAEDFLQFGVRSDTTVNILSTDQLTVSFLDDDYQGFENAPGALPRLEVTGTSDIPVDIALTINNSPAGEDYPADGVSVGTFTVPDTQSGTTEYAVTTLTIPENSVNDVNRVTQIELATVQNDLVGTNNPMAARYRILNDDEERMITGSGMTLCFDATVRVDDCADIGADSEYQLQDAFLAQTEPQFTSAGEDDDSADNTWTCTSDDRTGLTWAFETDAPVSRSFADASAFADSVGTFCTLDNWRLPTLAELYNLFDFSSATGLINTTVFDQVSTSGADFYWSADSDFGGTAWALSFNQGELSNDVASRFLMMVSDDGAAQLQPGENDPVYACDDTDESLDPALTSDHRFTLVRAGDDATVTDNLTGLTWTTESFNTDDSSPSPPNIDWGSALTAASDASYAGRADWRTPTIKELLSLLYFGCDPAGLMLTDLRLPPYFAPLMDGGAALPLMSSTPVAADVDDPLQLWVLTLDSTIPAAVLTIAAPPSSALPMQQFLVEDTN